MSWPELVDRQVHVWIVSLEGDVAWAGGLLAPAELERARRFRFELHRRRWMLARAALRSLLAGYLGGDPREIALGTDHGGKPRIPGLEFSLAHSYDLALVAVSACSPVGVDVELLRAIPEARLLARRFFPLEEARFVESHPEQFLRIWTRREAWLKAAGIGLQGLAQPRPAHWRILDLDPAPAYVGALACRPHTVVSVRQFLLNHRAVLDSVPKPGTAALKARNPAAGPEGRAAVLS